MINYDLHIHTDYCGHADGMTVEAIIRRSEELGLSTIAITDHIFGPEDHEVIQQIRHDVAAYHPSLKVYVGAEVDVDYTQTDGRLVTDQLDALDLVIAGFHYVPTVGNYPRGPQDNTLDDGEFLKHWHHSLVGIVSNPNIDILAHPGRLLAAAVDLDVYFEDALCVFAEAAAISAKNNIAWEINEMSGSRLAAHWLDQWHRIYETAVAEGVKLTYGSDAHTPGSVGVHEFVDEILKKLPNNSLASPEEVVGF